MSQRTIYDVQNDFGRSIGHGTEIIWDSLSADQAYILKEKIRSILPNEDRRQSEVEKARNNLFQNVWSQRKYTNRVLLSSIINVMVTEERDHDLAMHSSKFTLHPVIRMRKCLSSNNSSGCCMIFVDEHSRIYQNWQLYLKENILPSGTMVAPENGVYTLNEYDQVNLAVCATPNSRSIRKADTAIGVGGLISGAAPLAFSMVMPIAAPVMLTATAVSLVTSAYAAARSATHLKDRYKHGQSTSLADREARSNWLGVAGSVVGIGATGAMRALSYASSAGNGVPLAAKFAVGGINASSLLLSGTDIVNTIYDLYLNYDEGPSRVDILQLASSLLVFTHSMNNLALVRKIPTRGGSASVRNEIRKQTRNSLNKISNECLRLGRNVGNIDLIRIVNNIPSKDAFIQQIGLLLTNATAGKSFSSALSDILLITANGDLNVIEMLSIGGYKFVQNILDPNSFIDLLATMATYMCDKGFYLLLNLTKTFIDEFGDDINTVVRSLIPTEKILYEMFMLCVSKYTNLNYRFLESKQTEIISELEKCFYSLNPIDSGAKSVSCKFCKGYYYEDKDIK